MTLKTPRAKFPLSSSQPEPKAAPTVEEEPPKPAESDPESDIELELLDTVIEGDEADAQEMGDEDKEPSEEDMDQAGDLRSKAAKAYSNGEFEGELETDQCSSRTFDEQSHFLS